MHAWKNACLAKGEADFSFSGIKTAVLYTARGQNQGREAPLLLDAQGVADAAASFQRAAVHALVTRTVAAAQERGVRWIAVGGGVAANRCLRDEIARAAQAIGCRTAIPPMRLCTDNEVMVAARAHERWRAGETDDLALEAFARTA
jgi:N6-L-threonylcarbamoyladenine synthase